MIVGDVVTTLAGVEASLMLVQSGTVAGGVSRLDFLGLKDRFLERDLEDAILRELETFLLETGAGFSFVARQKRG